MHALLLIVVNFVSRDVILIIDPTKYNHLITCNFTYACADL